MTGETARRTVRIEDGLWAAAKAKADAEGKNLSDLIRAALKAYIDDGGEGPAFVPLPAKYQPRKRFSPNTAEAFITNEQQGEK